VWYPELKFYIHGQQDPAERDMRDVNPTDLFDLLLWMKNDNIAFGIVNICQSDSSFPDMQ
jgi:hypothetical protein